MLGTCDRRIEFHIKDWLGVTFLEACVGISQVKERKSKVRGRPDAKAQGHGQKEVMDRING